MVKADDLLAAFLSLEGDAIAPKVVTKRHNPRFQKIRLDIVGHWQGPDTATSIYGMHVEWVLPEAAGRTITGTEFQIIGQDYGIGAWVPDTGSTAVMLAAALSILILGKRTPLKRRGQ